MRMRGLVLMLCSLAIALTSAAVLADVSDDFDSGLNGDLWDAIVNGDVGTSPCGARSGDALNMFGDQGLAPREARTVPLDVSDGGNITFYIIFPNTDIGDCDTATPPDENIFVEYSVNGGTWTVMDTIPADSFNVFTQVSVSIPADARTENTAFRWIQYDYSDGSGDCCDQWALDDVNIPGAVSGETVNGVVVGPPCDNLFDGRINDNQSLDCAAPVAIYIVDGRVDVYAIDPNSGEGTLVISSSGAAAGAETEESGNVLLGSWGNVRLYWLPGTSEYLLQATYADGKPYEVVWSGDGSDLRHTAA